MALKGTGVSPITFKYNILQVDSDWFISGLVTPHYSSGTTTNIITCFETFLRRKVVLFYAIRIIKVHHRGEAGTETHTRGPQI